MLGTAENLVLADPPPEIHVEDSTNKYFIILYYGDRGSTVVKVLCYKSEGRWFDPSVV